MELVDKRPVAVISTQRDHSEQNWLRRVFDAAKGIDTEVHVVDPETTSLRVFKERLIRGIYGHVILDREGVDFYRKAHIPIEARGKFSLAFAMYHYNVLDAFLADNLGIDHIVRH